MIRVQLHGNYKNMPMVIQHGSSFTILHPQDMPDLMGNVRWKDDLIRFDLIRI